MLRAIRIKDLSLVRGERRLFSGLDLEVSAGQAVALTGRNGAGKTSLLRAVAGLLRPSEGVVGFEGEAGRWRPRSRGPTPCTWSATTTA
jgi:heme exporter protein A